MELTHTPVGCAYYREHAVGGDMIFDGENVFARAFTKEKDKESVMIFFDDVVDKNCRFLRFKKADALALAHGILNTFEN